MTAGCLARLLAVLLVASLLIQGCAPTPPPLPEWLSLSHGIPSQAGIAAVAVAPGNPEVLYLAAYEPGGLYRSNDAGRSWTLANAGLEQGILYALAVAPADDALIYGAALDGGFRSIDGGQTWQRLNGLPEAPLYALALGPDGAGGWGICTGGEDTGLWCSPDGGETWQHSSPPAHDLTVLSLAMTADGRAYAGTAGQGVWSSSGGLGWQVTGRQLASAHVTALAIGQENLIYALASGTLHRSSDRGATWQAIAPAELDVLSLAIEPGPPERIYLGGRGDGLAISDDNGDSWTLTGQGVRHADITCITAGGVAPAKTYLGTLRNGLFVTDDAGRTCDLISADVGKPVVTSLAQDALSEAMYAGTLDGVYKSTDHGSTWHPVTHSAGLLFVQALAVDPETPGVVYAGTNIGVFVSRDAGSTWQWATEPLGRITIFSLLVDTHDHQYVYAGSWGNNVLRSSDSGRTWAPIHHGLETLSAHSLAMDPTDPHLFYAGTVEAVYTSADRGDTWRRRDLSDRPVTTFALAVGGADDHTLYAATSDGVYRSSDGGESWQHLPLDHIDGQVSPPISVTALALHQADRALLHAGTEHHGLYRSNDYGDTWAGWGLSGLSVYALLVDAEDQIWAATDQGVYHQPLN